MSERSMSRGSGPAILLALLLIGLGVAMNLASGQAQTEQGPTPAQIEAREATGGAQTLEDILARQRGEEVSNDFRRTDPPDAAMEAAREQLGVLGLASDSDVWRDLRFGTDAVNVSTTKPEDRVLIQDAGMSWLQFREGPLRDFTLWVLGGMLAVLALFYLVRGRIRIDHGRSGVLIERFTSIERFGHWLLASSFILLAITGLALLFGREVLIPLLGKDSFAAGAAAGKWVHNNVAWPFMLALVLVFVQWVWHNLPDRTDLVWFARGGGLFSKGVHPPAKKFNAGQKMIFWGVIVLGASVSVSGLSLLFPFELPLFAKTFAALNQIGVEWVWGAPLPETLQPHQEMQYAQLWHAIVAVVMIAIIIAHIYLGSVGMEGAFDAMGSGKVDRNWAEEHHSLWVEEIESRRPASGASATPAE